MHSTLRLSLAISLSFALIAGGAHTGLAQDLAPPIGKPPVMQTVFFNVVWGAGTGAMLGAASASLQSGAATKPTTLRKDVITAATVGSMVGVAVGIWLVFNGVTFDPDRSLLFGSPLAANPYRPYTPPLVLISEPDKPFAITGFKALVLDLSF